MIPKTIRSTRLRNLSKTLILQIDVMEKFRKLAYKYMSPVQVGRMFMQASAQLEIPFFMVEQNKRAFGETAKEILQAKHPKVKTFEKFIMSAYEVPQIKSAIDDLKPDNILLYGLEAHACVLQTTLDLLDAGYNVHAVVDGITSFNKLDRSAAIVRMMNSGAIITTSEAALIDMMRDSKSPDFKVFLNIVKGKLKVDDPITELI